MTSHCIIQGVACIVSKYIYICMLGNIYHVIQGLNFMIPLTSWVVLIVHLFVNNHHPLPLNEINNKLFSLKYIKFVHEVSLVIVNSTTNKAWNHPIRLYVFRFNSKQHSTHYCFTIQTSILMVAFYIVCHIHKAIS